MHTVICVLGTIMLVRIAMRLVFWRRRGYMGGGCGLHRRFGFHPRHGRSRYRGPIHLGDLGDIGEDERASRWAQRDSGGDVGERVDAILRGLELNARQAAEAGDAIAVVRGVIGPERYPYAEQVILALRAVARDTFDVDLAEAAVSAASGPRISREAAREVLDALDHLHNILTEEQRAELARRTAREPRPSA